MDEINIKEMRDDLKQKYDGKSVMLAYTDASTKEGFPNSGWGVVFTYEDYRLITKFSGPINSNEDNTQAELFAIYIALLHLRF